MDAGLAALGGNRRVVDHSVVGGAGPHKTPGMDGALHGPLDAATSARVDAGGELRPALAGLDRAGFTDVYRAELSWVVSTLRRLGVAAADLQDAAQKVFTEVWRQRGAYDRARPLRPWLFGFAYRIVGDHLRGAWRKRAVFDEVDASPDDAASGEETLDAARNRRLVIAALEALELDRRAVFVMCDIDGASAPDTAAALGIPLGTVYSRLRLAREDFAAAVKRLRSKRGER